MKTIFKIFALGAISAACVSCIDLTTPTKSSFDESVVFSNYDLAQNSIMGVYADFGTQNGHRGRYLCYYGINTDIEAYTSTTAGVKLDIAAYDCTPDNSQLSLDKGPFASMYEGIERVNLCIKGLREYGNVAEKEDMRYLLGEALVLRAVLYADLMKAYGEVPARFEPVSPSTIYLNKSDKDVIFKQILADIEESSPYLPHPNGNAATASTGRISKSFAEGLYARLALAASGWSWRPAEGKVGTGDLSARLHRAFRPETPRLRTALEGLQQHGHDRGQGSALRLSLLRRPRPLELHLRRRQYDQYQVDRQFHQPWR